jgi:squalene-hopene/tetraprenyl-beta-curcumene cyclase
VLSALASLAAVERSAWFEPYFERLLQHTLMHGAAWLIQAQQPNGAWSGSESGPVSVEESALAIAALARALPHLDQQNLNIGQTISRGADWLIRQVDSGAWKQPSPIGFYFARLWYYERLYPMIFTVGALAAVSRLNQTI